MVLEDRQGQAFGSANLSIPGVHQHPQSDGLFGVTATALEQGEQLLERARLTIHRQALLVRELLLHRR